MEAFLRTGKVGPSSSKINKQGDAGVKKPSIIPWVEKYRPKCVDDIVYQDEVVAVLKKSLSRGDLPNLLFYGPPGTGKTSTILAASRELFGDMFRQRVLELNASDERGIQVIREKVKNFAQTTVSSIRPDGKACPPFKIVILDEADNMTSAAQAALRRTMEKESKQTRFCLICNYISRIIEPLTSRCSKFRFKPLENDILMKRLTYICEQESVKYDSDALKKLIAASGGDLRMAITALQSAARLRGDENVRGNDIHEITGVVPDNWLHGWIEVCSSNAYDEMKTFLKSFLAEGYSASQLISQVHDLIVMKGDMTDESKAAICEKMAMCDLDLLDGSSEYIQLLSLSCTVMKYTLS